MLLTTVTTAGFLGDRSVPSGANPPLPGLIVSYETNETQELERGGRSVEILRGGS